MTIGFRCGILSGISRVLFAAPTAVFLAVGLAACLAVGLSQARAQGESQGESGASGEASSVRPEKFGAKPRATRTKGKRVREKKEAEGTQALNRFEADTIHKSQYKFNGEQLEVDPD